MICIHDRIPENSAALISSAIWNVDIPDLIGGQRFLHILFQQFRKVPVHNVRHMEFTIAIRYRNALNAQESSFKGSSHSPGILDVGGYVVAMIDTGQNNIGFPV